MGLYAFVTRTGVVAALGLWLAIGTASPALAQGDKRPRRSMLGQDNPAKKAEDSPPSEGKPRGQDGGSPAPAAPDRLMSGRRSGASLLGSDRPVRREAQDSERWMGKLVVPKRGSFKLREEGHSIDPRWCRIYRVKGVNEAKVFLKAEGAGLEGWAPASEVVPLDEADALYTAYIKSDPRDDAAYSNRAGIYLYQLKYDLAIKDATTAIRRTPRTTISAAWRGT